MKTQYIRMKKLLKIKDVSSMLNVKIGTIYTWVKRNKIPYIRIGSMIRFDEDDLKAWLKNKQKGV